VVPSLFAGIAGGIMNVFPGLVAIALATLAVAPVAPPATPAAASADQPDSFPPPAPAVAAEELPVVRIAIVTDGPWERNEEVRNLMQQEILELTRTDFDVRFPPELYIEGDWTQASVEEALKKVLSDPTVDVVIAAGVLATNEVVQRRNLPKPVIAPAALSPELQDLPLENGTSGVRNLNYLLHPRTMLRDVEVFLQIVPFEHMAILGNQVFLDNIPGLSREARHGLDSLGVDATMVPVGESVDEMFSNLPVEVEAVYVMPLLHLSRQQFDKLVDGLIERKVPSFSHFGDWEVERGLLAGLTPDIMPRLARRVAIAVQRVLLGDDAGDLSVAFSAGERLTINMATARAIGISPSWAVRTEARLVSEAPVDRGRTLTLTQAVREALVANLTLLAARRSVAAGEKEVGEARSALLPRVDLSASGVIIDQDRAESSFGQQAERTVTGSASVSQLLYSDPAWAGYSVSKSLQEARVGETEIVRLDVMQSAATAYLDVLRAETFERVQQDNLRLTRSNLELAQVRRYVGYAGPAEVHRWESQIATNRKDAIEASARRNVAEVALNRILDRPLEEPFSTVETGLHDTDLVTGDERFAAFLHDKRSFRAFRDFMAEEARAHSPELRRLDALVAAKRREHGSATRAFWLPTLALRGGVTERLDESGAGSDFSPPAFLGGAGSDDTDWNVGLVLSYPLFSGGGKFATRGRTRIELERLEVDRASAGEAVEQRVRSALHRAGASYAGIEQARRAADAARKNLELVTDAYSRGTVSILELLDAQNAYLVADEAAENAVYEFLIDYIEVERAVGRFYSFAPAEEREDFLSRGIRYLDNAGALSSAP
jgi:outer membrane protein